MPDLTAGEETAPFDVRGRCPKCGGWMDRLSYVDGYGGTCFHAEDAMSIAHEHLHRSCSCCGYTTWEPVWGVKIQTSSQTAIAQARIDALAQGLA